MKHAPNTREQYLEALRPLAYTYDASPRTKRSIHQVQLTVVSGVSGVGKDAVIQRSGLHNVQSETTRERRPGETTGTGYSRFYNLDHRFDRWTLRRSLVGRKLVQAEVFANGEIYASRPANYQPVSVLNATARTCGKLAAKGLFGRIGHVHLVSPSAGRWLEQLNNRDGVDDSQREARINDAEPSLRTALEDKGTIFIINDTLETAAEQLSAVAHGAALTSVDIHAGRAAAINMLAGIQDVIREHGLSTRPSVA